MLLYRIRQLPEKMSFIHKPAKLRSLNYLKQKLHCVAQKRKKTRILHLAKEILGNVGLYFD